MVVEKLILVQNDMKKRIIFMTIMILVAVCAFGQNAKKYYKAGTEFVENLKYDDAVVQFTNAINLEPSNPEYYYSRGEAYQKLLKFAEAKTDFEKTLIFSPKDVDAMVSLGAVCNNLGSYDQSLRILNHVTNIDKRNTRAYPEKVIALANLGRYDQALQVSDTALIIKDTPMDYYWRGIIYRKLDNDLLAKKELEKSISKDKKLAEPRIELADLLIASNPKEAMIQCNEVIKNDDRNTKAYVERSKVFKKNLDYPNAINDISKTILLEPENSGFYFERGKYYQEFNQHLNAINDFTKTIALNTAVKKEDPAVYYSRAKSYEDIMDYDKARADYNKITYLSQSMMRKPVKCSISHRKDSMK